MTEYPVKASLTAEEWELICHLRDITPGRSREHLLTLVREVTAFTAEPRCSQMQADGVPCASVHSSCDDCQRISSCLVQLRQMLRTPEASDLA